MFKSFLKIEFKRTFFRWQTLVAFIVFMAVFIHIFTINKIYISGSSKEIQLYNLEANNCFYSYINALIGPTNSYMLLVFPLIISLLIGDSLFSDYNTGFFNFTITRIDLNKYFKFKSISCMLIAFIINLLFQVIAFLYCLFNCPYYMPSGKLGSRDMIMPTIGFNIYIKHPFIYVFLIMLILSFVAATMAIGGLIVSNKLTSLLKVILVPWIIYVFTSIGLMCVFPQGSVFYKITPLQFSGANIMDVSYNILFVYLYWIVLGSILYFVAYRTFFTRFKGEVVGNI